LSRELLLFTRPGCTLCEELLGAARPIVQRHGVGIRKINIDRDPELRRRYGLDIPVLMLEENDVCREVCRHRLDVDALEGALAGR
jgi:hypothetical protein